MKYAWIKEHRDEYSVVRLCHAMQVSKSGFYSWLNSEPSPRKKRTDSIRKAVLEVYQESNSIYGSYKIAEVLKSEAHLETACCLNSRVKVRRVRLAVFRCFLAIMALLSVGSQAYNPRGSRARQAWATSEFLYSQLQHLCRAPDRERWLGCVL